MVPSPWRFMERDLYKQIKPAETLAFKYDTVKKWTSFKATSKFFNFLSFKKNQKKTKTSCSKIANFISFFNSTQKYDDWITRYFPFSKREFTSKIECCVYKMHR